MCAAHPNRRALLLLSVPTRLLCTLYLHELALRRALQRRVTTVAYLNYAGEYTYDLPVMEHDATLG